MTVTCPEPECEGREFAGNGQLAVHNRAKHGAGGGVCELCVPPKEWKNLAAHQRGHKVDAGAGGDSRGPGAAGADTEPAAASLFDDNAERAPRFGDTAPPPPSSSRKGKLRDKVRGKLWGAEPKDAAPANSGPMYGSTAEKPPKSNARRADTAPIMSLVWGGAGWMLERTNADVPVGRTMQFQAEHAGVILDRLIARTWVDKLLQPLAAKADEVEALGALFAMPVLVAVVERSPGAAVSLEPLLREAVRANLVSMAPVVKRKRAEAKRFAEAVEAIDPGLAAEGDPVATILAAIFAPPPQAPTSSNGSEPASATVAN